MAKAKTAGEAPKKKKKVKAVTKAKPAAKKSSAKKGNGKGFDALGKLADHPLVAELLAVGAMAAVVAIAEQTSSSEKGKKRVTANAVKTAGQAAAAAIGKRLISEFEAVKKASKKA